MSTVVSRATARRLAGTVAAAGAGGGFFIGLSRVAPLSLAVLGATLVVVIVVLAFAGYKVIDRLLRYLEQIASLHEGPPRNKRTPARPGPPVHRGKAHGAARR